MGHDGRAVRNRVAAYFVKIHKQLNVATQHVQISLPHVTCALSSCLYVAVVFGVCPLGPLFFVAPGAARFLPGGVSVGVDSVGVLFVRGWIISLLIGEHVMLE